MSTPIQQPNTSQASQGSLGGKIRDVLTRWLREEVDDMLPAVVISYDDDANTAVVRPLVMVGTTDGLKVSRSQLPPVPVFRFGGGEFFIRFPIKPGDFGWIKAQDRDVSLVMQRGGAEDWPNTTRLHSFSDGIFIPHAVKDWIIAEEDADAAVFQSLDGITKVALHADKAVIACGETRIEISETSVIQTVGASVITTTAAGVAIVSPTLTHNGINIGSTHRHKDVTPGTGNSGVPV
jgi:hypothetical protein